MCGTVGEMVDSTTNYLTAARAFSGLVDRLPADCWALPGLGGWDLHALTGHTSRSLITVSAYLRRPARTQAVATPEEYYLQTTASVATDAAAVHERGRQAGEALGEDPASVVRSLVADVRRDLDRGDDPLIDTIVGGMRLSSYLPTRTFELAVHSLDIAAATGSTFTLPEEVLEDAVALPAGSPWLAVTALVC